MEGTKYDSGKLRLDLIPPEIIQVLGEIFTFGCERYGEGNWAKGLSENRLIAAARRHDLAFAQGEEMDPDSGLPHLAHAAWNLLIAQTLRERNKAENKSCPKIGDVYWETQKLNQNCPRTNTESWLDQNCSRADTGPWGK